MAQGTFVQALRKEAALSGTFMKGRSLMLNGAVLSIEDSGSRFSKNVTVEGSVRGSRGDLYKTHVALDMDEHEVVDYDCDCPAAYRYPGMCKHAIATALAYLDTSGIEPVEGLRTPVRTFTAQPKQPARAASAAPAVNPNFPFPAPVPTSPSLVAALSDLSDARMDELASMRRKLAGAVDPDAPKAALEPSLVPYYNPLFADRFSWALEFRIRCGSVSYVVKDIDGMADAYVRGGTFSYGKKLHVCPYSPRPSTTCRQSCSTLSRRQLPISMTSQARVRRRTTLPAVVLLPSVSCRCPSIASYMCWTCCAARPSPLSPPGRGG